MKKTILISFLLLSCVLFYGQGSSYNLGFSQVLNFEYNTSMISAYQESTVGSLTVPSGKVWKVSSGSCYPSPNNNAGCSIRIGNNVIYMVGNSASSAVANTPTWLNPGSYSVVISSILGQSSAFLGALTIVEFNIE